MQKTNSRVGSMWQNVSKSGDPYFTLKLKIDDKEHEFVIFSNQYKQIKSEPDFRVLRSEKSLGVNFGSTTTTTSRFEASIPNTSTNDDEPF